MPVRMLNEFTCCPRLFYLEWVQGEFVDNEFTFEGRFAHRRVDSRGGAMPAPGEEAPFEVRSVALSSAQLGLSAKIDLVEGEGEAVSPLRGRCMARPRAGLLRSIQRSEGSRVNGSGLVSHTVRTTAAVTTIAAVEITAEAKIMAVAGITAVATMATAGIRGRGKTDEPVDGSRCWRVPACGRRAAATERCLAGSQPVDVVQGRGNDTGDANGSGGSNGDTGTPPGVESSNATLELGLHGVDAGDLRLVRLRVQSVEIRAGTTVLATELMTPEMDLTQGEQPFLLSTFHAPAAGDEVEFTVALSSASVETANERFEVDARCEVLKLTGKMSLIAKRNHAVVHLDLARSFVKAGTSMAFVPHLQLVF